MNKELHELLNMKARRLELEVELGTRQVSKDHLSTLQRQHIQEDIRRGLNSEILLEMVEDTIEYDETIIHSRH